MPRAHLSTIVPSLFILTVSAAAAHAADGKAVGYGPSPRLPKPEEGWLPTVNIAPASSWKDGQTPKAASGLEVKAFASGLDHPRMLYVLPNGDVLVAESNKPEDGGGRSGVK